MPPTPTRGRISSAGAGRALVAVVAVACGPLMGCSTTRLTQPTVGFASPAPPAALAAAPAADVETLYARAVAREQAGDRACLDDYAACCRLLWPELTSSVAAASHGPDRRVELYNSSVARLVVAGRTFGAFDAVQGLRLAGGHVPVETVGFGWRPDEIVEIEPVRPYRPPGGIEPKRHAGLGCPVLVTHRTDRPFVEPVGVGPATVTYSVADDGSPRVRLINPGRVRALPTAGGVVPVGYDMTAPTAYYADKYASAWIDGFRTADEGDERRYGLVMIEPYRPGKIPVLFVHGLASDPTTWMPMLNELVGDPAIASRYQFWFFWYPTGKPFVGEAATLRRELRALRDHVDPARRDPALDRLVLVGHSMGGLISKLQVTASGDRLANAIFNKPVDQLRMPADAGRSLRAALFFEPTPEVSRVVFIGTPHGGSQFAGNLVGRLAKNLVRLPQDALDDFAELRAMNGDALRTKNASIPTSIDLLRPDNPVLGEVARLPVATRVRMHSVIGVGHTRWLTGEKGDGVVALKSARHPGVDSEKLVDADHVGVHAHPDTFAEVKRILYAHAGPAAPRPVAGVTDLQNATAPGRQLPRPAATAFATPVIY